LEKLGDNQRRFRLIDFGRSKWVGDWSSDSEKLKCEAEAEANGYSKELGWEYAQIVGQVDPKAWDEWDKERFEEKSGIYNVVEVLC
jgi:hypothetical protein